MITKKMHTNNIKSHCTLCGNEELVELEAIDVKKIVSVYKKQFGIDTALDFSHHKIIKLFHCPQCDLRFFLPTITGSDSFYETLQKIDWYYQDFKKEYDYCSYFTENKNILEIGCGAGFYFKHSKATSYKGIEFNQEAINACQEKGLDVESLSISEMSKLHPNKFDVVCSFQVLEHVKAPMHFIQDALTCLKRHGLLFLSVPSEDSFVALARNNVLNMPPHHVTRWPNNTFHYIADHLNIELIKIQHNELDPIHYNWYSSILGQQIIKTCLSQPTRKLFNETIADKVTSKIGSTLGTFLNKAITQKMLLPKGHTVSILFKKP
jgi:2-polyprenyl-3-methyl-5-hydroxy-6-metoxy-1,4-benzoquinol methylase